MKNEESAKRDPAFKVLFVCTANICRSPMAEAIFNDLAEERGLSAAATSAGVHARPGHDMAPNTRVVLEEMGFSADRHGSRPVTREMIDGTALILTMTTEHSDILRKTYGNDANVMTLPEFAGDNVMKNISDPYGMTTLAYRSTARRVLDLVEKSLDRIQETSDGSTQ